MAGDRADAQRDATERAAALDDRSERDDTSGGFGPAMIAQAAAAGPDQVAAILRRFPAQQSAMLHWLHQHCGNGFVQRCLAQARAASSASPAVASQVPASITTPTSPGHASALAFDGRQAHARHAASAHQVAERDHPAKARPNMALKVIVYGETGEPIKVWGSKGIWEGPLPQHFRGHVRAGVWSWDDASARTVHVNTNSEGHGGTSVEAWASQLHGVRIEIYVEPIDAVTARTDAAKDSKLDTHAPGHATDPAHTSEGATEHADPTGHGPGTGDKRLSAPGAPGPVHGGEPRGGKSHEGDRDDGTSSDHAGQGAGGREPVQQSAPGTSSNAGTDVDEPTPGDPKDEQLADEFERELGIDAHDDADDDGAAAGEGGHGGHGYQGGEPENGRTGDDASTTGSGPGGHDAKEGGQEEGSTSARGNEGTKTGDKDGIAHGSENGRFDGEGNDGDQGVRGAGALFGGVIAVPEALQGAVELALLIEAGDITGAGAELFTKGIGKAASVAAARRLVAREARIFAMKETRAIAKQLAGKEAFTALAKAERERVLRIVYWETQRRYFRAYLKAAKAEQRAVRNALRKARPAQLPALEARRAAADMGEEIAKVEPVAGRLPRNHAYAGREFPRSQLPAKYKKQGLRFKDTGYPDFEPYAKTLSNGEKKVRITYQGTLREDFTAANKAAKLERTPEGYTWHHDEADLGAMYLVPRDLHDTVKHSGGVAMHKHVHGVTTYGD